MLISEKKNSSLLKVKVFRVINIIPLYIILQGICLIAHAQLPVVNLPVIPTATQVVYIHPDGKDSNPGTIDEPKKTFFSAIQSLNFGISGVNGGHSYVEVICKEGHYYPKGSNGFVQNLSDWRKFTGGGYVYKNISIRGLGNVVLHGDSLDIGAQNVIFGWFRNQSKKHSD